MNQKSLPTISVVIPIFNEEKNLKRLLRSFYKLTYPRQKLDVIIVDDGSTDIGPQLAREYGARVIQVETHDIELNKGIGMHAAKGDLIYWLDADMEILDTDYFEKMVRPFENDRVIATFTNEYALDKGSFTKNSLLRFISYDPLQCDPLYQYFSTSIDETIVEDHSPEYFLCEFSPGKVPPCGRSMYKRKKLLQTSVGKDKSFIDLESLEIVVRHGHRNFAYVPNAHIRHYHATTLSELTHKRLRNLERDYLPNIQTKYFVWFDAKSLQGKIKIVWWIIYANLIVPELLRGIAKAIRYRDYAFLWHPIVSIATTDAILFGFLTKPEGRRMIRRFLSM